MYYKRQERTAMSRKIPALLLFLTFTIAALTGCSGGKNRVVNEDTLDSQEIVTITFFGNKYEPDNVTVIEQIMSEFMKENPYIRVSYESLKGTAYFDALEKRMESGKGDDIFMVKYQSKSEITL
jgi:raffinose/stachyose/melibiose transport system substrate-binding protein